MEEQNQQQVQQQQEKPQKARRPRRSSAELLELATWKKARLERKVMAARADEFRALGEAIWRMAGMDPALSPTEVASSEQGRIGIMERALRNFPDIAAY